jgi:hypothetical protein
MSPLSTADQGKRLLLDLTDCPGDVVGGAGDVAGVHHLGFVHRFNVELRVVTGRRSREASRTAAGPKRAPGRKEVPPSNGTPTIAMS